MRIGAGSTNAALAAQITTKTVPIVMRAAADQVAVGLVESSSAARREHYRRHFSAALSAQALHVLRESVAVGSVSLIWEADSAVAGSSIERPRWLCGHSGSTSEVLRELGL